MSPLSRFLPIWTALACALGVAASCAPGADSGGGASQGFEARDSAGVRIVVNRVPTTGFSAFATVAPTPTLHIGGEGGGTTAVSLSGVTGAVVLPGGMVAVAEAARVGFFGSDGVLLSEVGGTAEGGEGFTEASRMGWVGGDTLWIADHRAGRLSLVTPGGVVATHAFPKGLTVAGRFDDGGYLLVPAWSTALLPEGAAEGVRRDQATWARWSPTELSAEHVGDFVHDEIMVVEGPDGPVVGVPPFGRRTAHAVGAGGFFQGDAETFEIRSHESDGTLISILRLEGVDLTLTEELKASVRPLRAQGPPSLVDRFWEGVPDTRPAYTRFLVDSDDRLWVAEHVAGTAPARGWLVFDPEGKALGLVTLPVGFRLLEVGGDYLLGVVLEGGREGVVRHRLVF